MYLCLQQREEFSVTSLHAKARHHQPNKAVLSKLRYEMKRLHARQVGTLIMSSLFHWGNIHKSIFIEAAKMDIKSSIEDAVAFYKRYGMCRILSLINTQDYAIN